MHPRRTVVVRDDSVVVHDYAQHATPAVARATEVVHVNAGVASSLLGDLFVWILTYAGNAMIWVLQNVGLLLKAAIIVVVNVAVHGFMALTAGGIWVLGRSGDTVGALGDGYRALTRGAERSVGGSPKRLAPGMLPWLPANKYTYKELALTAEAVTTTKDEE